MAEKKADISKLKCLVVDNGLYASISSRLARDFGTVYYTTNWENAFPRLEIGLLGTGLPGVNVVKSAFEVLDDVDLVVFPDTYYGPMQAWLAKRGMRVWGARMAEEFELDRVMVKEVMKKHGLPVNPYSVVVGVTALREYLASHPRQYVKLEGNARGHAETFFAENVNLISAKLDDLAYQFGAWGKHQPFLVESPLPEAVELGVDAYNIDGQLPSIVQYGIETKGLSYLGMVDKYVNLPEPLTRFDTAMAGEFKKLGYRGFYSTEVRIDKSKTPYMIDLCSRAGSPPNESYQEIYTNISEIIWEGSGGIVVAPKCLAKYCAQLILQCEWAEKHWEPVEFPAEYRKWIKLRNCVRLDGKWHCIPQASEVGSIGSAIGFGNTIQEAIAKAREVAGSVRGHGIEVPSYAFDAGVKSIKQAWEFGLPVFGGGK